ncbi:YfjI family protein [Sinorhizobium meliloti]|uniref:YfjI family protein n=1 Tax=Rhizobium meliloti TaxID=382 RepID=UPI000FD83F72|nr:YfjI family protein [Sinorhizobium meliloti]RVG89296.1 DUF3987 domain-containing protein [Sinorhizobium meliloti]RVI33955.1 DUF3987 domain-containing protein [Sinorhizobium meliloti]RVI45063.1 DUF3987 domain-containing protein [Sinorhizobium meliloti]RVJ30168.1 DUF3987 domain-containing protein [Sinorhizobium meliloti]RVK03073.1 DUF3987 domain-containing protein [Sinorhizobium meliloti]
MNVVEVPFKAEGPTPLLRAIPKSEAYPVASLGPIASTARAVHDKTQAPIGIAAQTVLSLASLAVQGFSDVETLSGSTTPCSLFCLTVALSGERKSACFEEVRAGISQYEVATGEIYAVEKQKFDIDYRIFSETQKRLMAEASGANKVKAEEARESLGELGSGPVPPISPKVVATDITLEGLLKFYQVSRPSIGFFNDEAATFTDGHAMNSDNRLKTMAGLSSLWNGSTIDSIRAGDGIATYRGRRLAMHLMVQPVVARTLLADPSASGQGFLARFLITEPESLIGTRLRRGHSIDSERELEAFARRLRNFLSEPLPTQGSNRQELAPRILSLSSSAKELLWQFYEYVEKGQAKGQEFASITAFASKAAEQAARIAAVLTLWDDINAREVTPQAMQWGVELAQYYLMEARRLLDVAVVTPDTERAEVLRAWLMDSWPYHEIVPREVVQYGPNSLRETAVVKETLKSLERSGWLVRLPTGATVRGQARKEAYRVEGKNHAV